MDDTEIEVARILLKLPQLFHESEFLGFRFSSTWSVKRRRSSSSEVVIPTTLPPVLSPSLPSPPSVPEPSSAPVGPSQACETEKSKALSPSTPLLFAPSESDDKSTHSKRRVSVKRKREECLPRIDKLTESNQSIQKEIRNLQRHYDQIKALNLKFKARKEMITTHGLQKETHQSRLSSSNLAMEPAVPQPTAAVQFNHRSLYYTLQHPQFHHQTAHNNAETLRPYDGHSPVSVLVNDNVGPVGIPDLNLSLEESFERQQQNPAMAADQIGTKALAAQARQRRMQICRSKNPNAAAAASKLRFPVYR